MDQIAELWAAGGLPRAAIIALSSVLLALVTGFVFRRVVLIVVRNTETDLDDVFAENLRRPVTLTVVLIGMYYAVAPLGLPAHVATTVTSVIGTSAVVLWALGFARITTLLLEWLQLHQEHFTFVNRRTFPMFEIAGKGIVYGAAIYALFVAWGFDVRGWLASAGIVGVAIGFASQETLSNLISGVFILADGPYRLGDYLVLDSGARGRVTEIGVRATRLITNDDIEIIVPNAMMANAQIVNESGGPHVKARIKIEVGVAYGSDIDRVRDVLLEITEDLPGLADLPTPKVHFAQFGASSLDFQLLVWIDNPGSRAHITDQLNSRIYKRFNREEIEIPYNKMDVYLYPQKAEET